MKGSPNRDCRRGAAVRVARCAPSGARRAVVVLCLALAATLLFLAAVSPAVAANMDVVLWGQRDSRWAGKSLGGSAYKMGDSGCAVTACSMVANYYGSTKDPGQVCDALNANGGLTSGGLIVWSLVPAAAGGTISYGGYINYMDDAEVAANVSWQNYERSWSLWKTRALAKLAEEKRTPSPALPQGGGRS